jgi:hypothetical protein
MKNFKVTVMLSHMTCHEVDVRAKDELDAMEQAAETARQYEAWRIMEGADSFVVTDSTAVKVDE